MGDYNLQDFKSHFQQFNEKLERHRYKCLLVFAACSAVAALLIVFLPWYARNLAEALNKIAGTIIGGHWKEHASFSDMLSIAGVIVVISLFLVLWPIFSYHGSNRSAGMVPRDYSFKDYVYSHLLKYFGDFEFAPDGGMLGVDLNHATIIPQYQIYIAEDYIKGVVDESTVKIAETEIAQIQHKQRIAVFKGLLVVIDISETKVKLRGTFAGRTVLIADPQKKLPEIRSKYAHYQRFDLEDKSFENEFEAYTTNPGEAKNLLSKPFIETLLSLQNCLSNLKEQQEHFDDKIAYAAQAMLDYVKLPSRKKLAAEQEYDAKYETDLDITKEDTISMDGHYINRHVQAEFYDDKVLITIPCKNDLFETNSLFEPALNEEGGMLLFTLMQGIEHITAQLKKYFESR